MILRRALAIALVLGPAVAVAKAPVSPDKPPSGNADRIDAIRDEAKAVLLVQSVLDWYTRTVGEPSMKAETYVGHDALFSKESFATVAAAQKNATTNEQRRALAFLKGYLAGEYLARATAHFDDEAENGELTQTVRLSWLKAPVPYKQLAILAGNEKDARHRTEIESASATVWKEKLNPILARKEEEAQRRARELGYPSYLALAEEYRMVDLKALISDGEKLRAETDATYGKLLAERAKSELGLEVSQLHRADIARLRKAPRFEKFFPKELMIPAFSHFLDGIGLDLKTVAGSEIRVDDALHPQKEPRAACYSIRVPQDVRISVKPTGGLDDFVTFFHEGGHALHYANTTSKLWEFQQLGPYALTEGLAETFGHAWDDPAWLSRYRAFVQAWNKTHHSAIPIMTDGEIADLVRARVFEELYFLRRYGSAKLIYEAALHGGDPSVWSGSYAKSTNDLQALYRDLFGRAYGFALTEEDSLRFRTDVDDLLYAADYTRAFGLANTIHEALRKKHGANWYESRAVAADMKVLFAEGNRLQPDEVARNLGYTRFDFAPSVARFNRLLSGAK